MKCIFIKKNREKNLLKRDHSPQNHQSKSCTAENINFCIPCFTILILRNKLDVVHLKSHVKYKSDINQNVDISKLAGGPFKITLRNTTHVSDKADRNFQIRLLSEISVTIRTFEETEKKKKN